jgi:hypothetical protein
MLNYLKPKRISSNKIRLGPKQDGGYVVSEIVLDKCNGLFSYGIGNDISYEYDFFAKYNKPVFAFDHTINSVLPRFIRHKKEGLGIDVENCDDFINHFFQSNIKPKVLLKIDIEGSEYDYLLKADMDIISDITTGLILEVHFLDREDIRDKFIEMITKLNKYFVLTHTHANNWGDIFEYEGHSLYNVFELSFVNRSIVDWVEEDNTEYPIIGLDYSNNPNQDDFKFTFFNSIR